MQTDLLRYVGGPLGYSWWWIVVALGIVAVVLAWWLLVFVWTMPAATLRRIPVLRAVHRWVLRRKFSSAIRDVCAEHRAGLVSTRDACAAISRTLRSYLSVATGTRAQYLSLGEIGTGSLGAAAPVMAVLVDGQFDAASAVDVDAVGRSAEEVIAAWT